MKRLASLFATLLLAFAVAGCSSQGSSSDAPTDFKVTAGDGAVTVTWTAVEGVEYWIFYAQGDNVTTSNWVSLNGRVVTKATSPQLISGLANGTTYSFTINGRRDGGPGGAGAPTVVATPRLSGIAWEAGTAIGSERLTAIATGSVPEGVGNVAVSQGGAIYAALGSAGFASQANPVAANNLLTAFYSTPGFIAAGANGTLLLSTDGRAWTATASNTTETLYGSNAVGFGNYIVVGSNGTILTSPGGTEWTARTSGTTATLRAVTYGGAQYVAVGDGGTILTSGSGTTWVTVPPVTSATLRSVAHAALSSTVDGAITVTNVYVAVGDSGTVLTSNDAVTWTVRPALGSAALNAVVYGGQFVVVGNSGTIYTSPDGVAWTARTSGTTRDLTSVVRSLTGYLAVGDAGTYLTSN